MDRQPPSRRTLLLLVVPIVVLSLSAVVANALTPTLLAHHPLWIVILEPRNRNLLLTANKVDAVPFVVLGTLRRFLSDPLFFLLGHFYGQAAVRWAERQFGSGGGVIRGVERIFKRASWPMVFFFPGALVCVLAGETGMRVRTFLILNVSGTVFAVVALRLFAHTIKGPVDAVLRFNDRYVNWLTIGTIVLTVLWLIWQRRQGKSDLPSISAMREELENDG